MRIRTLDLLKIVLALALLASLIALLVPVAAGAAGTLVTLVDSDGSSQAQVDAGKLRVGDGDGKLTIDGTVLERETMKGRVVYSDTCGASATAELYSSCAFDAVPAGKTLIVTSLSIQTRHPSSHSIRTAYGSVGLSLAFPTNVMTAVFGPDRYSSITIAGEIPVEAGAQLVANANRTATDGLLYLNAYMFGYLVDNA
jgi:hypothetical protein